LYYQLRASEIGARVDAVFYFITGNGVSSNCLREVYEKSAGGVGAGVGGLSLSVPLEALAQLRADAAVPKYLLPICTVVCTEVATVRLIPSFCRAVSIAQQLVTHAVSFRTVLE